MADNTTNQEMQNAVSTGKKPTSGLAIAALVVGIVGLIMSWMPIVNNFAAILGVIALVLAVASVVATGKTKAKGGRGLAIASVIVAVACLAVVFGTQAMYVKAVDDALSGESATVGTSVSASVSSNDSTSAASASASASTSAAASSTTDLALGTPVTFSGGMTVVVNSVSAGPDKYDGTATTAVNVTYTYNGTDTGSFNLFDWKGQNADGVQNSATFVTDGTDDLNSGSLAAGGTVTGNLYFEGSIVKVLYSPSMFILNDDTASWVLG